MTHDVVDVRLEQVRGERLGLREHLFARAVQRAAADLQRPRPHRAGAARHELGVRLHERHLLHRDAEQLLHDHRERGLVALPVGGGADGRGHGAVVVDLDRAELLEQPARGDLDVGRHPDAELPASPRSRRRACSARSSS